MKGEGHIIKNPGWEGTDSWGQGRQWRRPREWSREKLR